MNIDEALIAMQDKTVTSMAEIVLRWIEQGYDTMWIERTLKRMIKEKQ